MEARKTHFLIGLSNSAIENCISAAAISVFFFLWSDYVDKQPNLNGSWYFTTTTIDSSYSKYKGLKVTYQVNLLQDELHITGYGEKISEELNGVTKNYYGKDRVQIEVTANINHHYLSRDTLALAYLETGTARKSSTFMKLVRYSDDEISGSFSSTAADTKGTVEWRRTIAKSSP